MLDEWDRGHFEQKRRFLDSRGALTGSYLVCSANEVRDRASDDQLITIGYHRDTYRNRSRLATVEWRTRFEPARVRTDLNQALFLLCFAFDDPANLAILTDLSPGSSPAAAAATLGIGSDRIKGSVTSYLPGYYIGREWRRWVWFLVEPYGEVAPLADSAHAVPMLQMLAAAECMQRTNLASRLAAFLVPMGDAQSDATSLAC